MIFSDQPVTCSLSLDNYHLHRCHPKDQRLLDFAQPHHLFIECLTECRTCRFNLFLYQNIIIYFGSHVGVVMIIIMHFETNVSLIDVRTCGGFPMDLMCYGKFLCSAVPRTQEDCSKHFTPSSLLICSSEHHRGFSGDHVARL